MMNDKMYDSAAYYYKIGIDIATKVKNYKQFSRIEFRC